MRASKVKPYETFSGYEGAIKVLGAFARMARENMEGKSLDEKIELSRMEKDLQHALAKVLKYYYTAEDITTKREVLG